jgi:voltage-gated potassium channel
VKEGTMPLRHHHHAEPLARFELFAGCTPAQLAAARRLLTLLTVDAGTVLMREGGRGMEFLLIAGGEAAVTIGGHHVATLGPGDFAGEMSLLGNTRRSATVTAQTPLTVYVANPAEFTALLEVAPSVAERIAETATARRAANRRAA